MALRSLRQRFGMKLGSFCACERVDPFLWKERLEPLRATGASPGQRNLKGARQLW